MTPIGLIISIITLATAINSGFNGAFVEGIKCWDCNSNINPLCYRFDPHKFASINCNKPPAQYHKQLLENGIGIDREGYLVNPDQSFCRKVLQYGDNGWTIIRGCGYLSERDLHHIDPDTRVHRPSCTVQEGYGNIYMKYCNCFYDECNSSFSLSINHVLILVCVLLTFVYSWH